jgi:cation transport regulator ChaC
MLLFVYGSLIDPIHRGEVLDHFVDGVPAILHGYARARSLHWYIHRCAGAQTDGLVLTDLDAHDFATLDRYEDVPTLYTREQVEVVDMGGAPIRCWVYLPTAWAAPSNE